MILRFLLIAGFCLIGKSWGTMLQDEFEEFIEPVCLPKPIEGQPPLINGQKNPLSQTMENFIALAEKLEAANPNLGLQNELFYFIRSYSYDNIEFNRLGDIVRWEPKESKLDVLNNFWEPEETIRTRKPEGVDEPFTQDEKCSLYHMISHSIIREHRKLDFQRSYTNETRDPNNHDFNLENEYPMEIGVVAIQGTNLAVELGRVLKGMYVGLQSNRKVDLSNIPRIPKNLFDGHQREIDRLFAVTLAEVIALSTWRPEVGQREKLAQDGWWISAPIGTNLNTSDICPMIYRLKNESAAFSYSSMRGAADGLILGKILDTVFANNPKVMLSQILRQYYGRGGIFETDDELGGNVWASFCNRDFIINSIEETIKEQTYLYQLLAASSYKYITDEFTWNYYLTQKSSIFGIYNSAIRDYCSKQYTLDKPEEFPRETPLDIVAVLDTSEGEEFIKKQQLILGYLAKEMDLRYSGSRMTILTDQRVPSAAASAAGTVLLKPVVEETFSSACAACAVTQMSLEDNSPSAPEDEVIIGINQYLQARKANQTEKNGVIGKVIIYFNLAEDQKNARPTSLQTRVEKALIDLRQNHIEVPIYPLGRSTNLVKKYARNEGTFVLSAIDEPEKVIARKLLQRVTYAPATLQYPDCSQRKNEKSAIFEYFVSPSAVQHWTMPAKYFYKSINMKIIFESKNGPIRVCHNRATPSPELQKVTCADIENGQRKDFVHSNPCEDFDAVSCSPFYFSVIGVNATNDKRVGCMDTSDINCRTLDQTYFKVTHEGVRCSGSAAIMANAVLLFIGVFLLNFLSKKY